MINNNTKLLNKKLEYWEHQLLDLGKRNKMINYRETKRTTLKLVEPSFSELFKRLATNEETLTFQRSVDRETDVRVFSVLSLLEHLSNPLPVTIGDIKTEGSILERQRTLKNMRAKSRLALEEQGTNILYLSFGFIEWKNGKGASAQWIKSPLVLVPVTLVLESLNSPYKLSKHEDDIVVNPTLEYYLKTEYGIELPHFDHEKNTVDEYLESLEEIADQRGWKILKEVSLGLLSFLKITMYNDLRCNEKRIKNNPVIRAMAGDSEEVNDIPEGLRDYDLDSIKTKDCFQVMSADSSQQEAILYSKNGVSFVMQGPPGTGKSQTITNIIAEALADGKKVLFVSEKMAALQVVYRRLQETHLGEFCLPLHSYKANKKEILEQIGANLKLKQTKVKDAEITKLEELEAIRYELNKYASELHEIIPELNLSCYDVYGKLEEMTDVPSVSFSFENPLNVSQSDLQNYINVINNYSLSLKRLNYFIENNPWDGLSCRLAGYEYSERMREELTVLSSVLKALIEEITKIYECESVLGLLKYSDITELKDILGKISCLEEVPDNWLNNFNIAQAILSAEDSKRLYTQLFELQKDIEGVFNNTIFTFSYNEWKEKLLTLANGFIGMPLISAESSGNYIKNAPSILETMVCLKDLLIEADKIFTSVNNMLGTSFTANAHNQQIIADLLVLIQNNTILQKNWFSPELSEIKSLVIEAKEKSETICALKEKVLGDWESEILTLDYSPILLRYKTDYTKAFRIFNSQYRQDRKTIQGMSKNIIKKLPDDIAIELLSTLKEYHETIEWFDEKTDSLRNALSSYYKGIDSNWNMILAAITIAEKISCLPVNGVPSSLVEMLSADHRAQVEILETYLSSLITCFAKVRNISASKQILINVDSSEFNSIDTVNIINSYINRLNELIAQKDLLVPFLINSNESIDSIYVAIEKLNQHKNVFDTLSDLVDKNKELYGFLFEESTTDWDRIISLLNDMSEINQSVLFDSISPLVNVSASRKQELKYASEQISTLLSSCRDSFVWLQGQFSADSDLENMLLNNLYSKMYGCLNNIDILEGWIDYQEAKDDCYKFGLTDFIDKTESAKIYEKIDKVFLKGFYIMWLGAVCDKSDSVRRFRRNTHDDRVKNFVDLDDRQLLIAQMRIREKLIENLPSSHHLLKATDEVAILNKELSKKRNIMPLRKLFKLIPNLLMKLKPCLMMSPLSVSYFLETEAYHFDLVIFDEASQIFPEDAIGAIFRGSQVIIAGDSKQLPPTNFFASTTNNFDGDYDLSDEDDYSEVVSDSILEEADSVLPKRTLLWHYRSKHENLIAFSNREIYKNNLITFPNSINNAPDMGVEYVYVEDGCYEGGGKNCNIKEAQRCVELVVEHIRKHPERSLGIIAFSEKQQTAIENAIIDFRERNPFFEYFFDETKDEPFFVKNLENVQGDERDTIIFSICYAKDINGRMFMRFGPLGHDGGERRLNVAITRAKCNIKLVGSILPSDIDLNRTNSEGVRMLRSYIEFALKGENALRPVERDEAIETSDEFCDMIAAFLENNGYKIRKQVGCSDYKIDIAVENPNSEGEFIAGIECDGLSYIQAKTARDRDHLRRTVLGNMGWNLYRVWSTEWCRNPQKEGDALLDFLHSVFDENGNVTHLIKRSNEEEPDSMLEEIATETVKRTPNNNSQNPYGFEYYKEANWWDAPHSDSYDNLVRISENVVHILSVEQPMHMDLLYKRMGPSFTAGKATESVKRTIDEAIKLKLKGKIKIDKDSFIIMKDFDEITVRIPKRNCEPRPMEYIYTQEVATAMVQIIKHSFGLTVDDLASECARVFGFERKGPKIKAKTDAAIQYLIKKKMIKIIDGKAQLIGE